MTQNPFEEDRADRNNRMARADDWGSALVMACLALGVAMSWGAYELRSRMADQSRVRQFRHDLDLLSSHQSDVGELLADPRTHFVRLFAVDGHESIGPAAVAWNDTRQAGVFFCDDPTAGAQRRLQIWLVSQSGSATSADVGVGQPGQTIYTFSPVGRAAPPSEIDLTLWSEALDPAGLLARGEVR